MKKFLATALFTLGIVLMQFAQAEAREIYAFSETRSGQTTDTYVLTNTIESTNYGKKVTLHSVGKNFNYNKYWEVGFMTKGTDIYIIWLPSTATTLIATNGGDTVIKSDYDSYLLTETVSYKPVGGKMMTFFGTVREGSTKFDYDYLFYSDGLVVYDKMYYGEKRGSGRFNATSPGSYSNTVAYKAFVAILKMYGLI